MAHKNDKHTIETLTLEEPEHRWSKLTYTSGQYYINCSGLVCPVPDNIHDRTEIREEIYEQFKTAISNRYKGWN